MWNLWSNQSLFRWKFRSHLASHGHKSFDWRQVSKHLLFFVMVKKNTRSLKKQEGGGGVVFFFVIIVIMIWKRVCVHLYVFFVAHILKMSQIFQLLGADTLPARNRVFFFYFGPRFFPLFFYSLSCSSLFELLVSLARRLPNFNYSYFLCGCQFLFLKILMGLEENAYLVNGAWIIKRFFFFLIIVVLWKWTHTHTHRCNCHKIN